MSRHDKLISKIRNNPKDVRIDDACKIAEWLGFTGHIKSSHKSFSRTGEPIGLNFQDIGGGKIKPYQARQLIEMLDKYEDERRAEVKATKERN